MSNKVRIIGGEWRSRVLTFPALPGLRPTPDRVRETLFNWLGQDLHGKTCLDMFAGSGALGFEAASRGAQQVIMLEQQAPVASALRDNAGKLQARQIRIARADAVRWLQADSGVYDVIFLDPPFQSGLLRQALPLAATHLQAQGLIYAESGAALEAPPGLRWIKQGKAGQVYFGLLAGSHDV